MISASMAVTLLSRLWWCCYIVCSTVDFRLLMCTGAPTDTMELEGSLTPQSEPLQSASAAFQLSFRPPPSSSNDTAFVYLAISFAFALGGPPAWVMNPDHAVTSTSAVLTLNSDGDLALSDPSVSSDPVWASVTTGVGVVRMQLTDTGNLVLLTNRSVRVWQSFDFPTDTLLPGQNFTGTTRMRSNRSSWLFSAGRYFLMFSAGQGMAIFNPPGYIIGAYWKAWAGNTSFRFEVSGTSVNFYGSHSLVLQTVFSDVSASSYGYRLTLDADGNLRLYAWHADSTQWKVIWMAFTDICSRWSNVCGDYGICIYNPNPTCVCPQGFTIKDPTDLSAGCVPLTPITISSNCGGRIDYLEMEGIDYPFNDIGLWRNTSMEKCKQMCSSSCSCLAAVFAQSEDYGFCYLKQAIQYGYQLSSQRHRTFLKISASDASSLAGSIEDRVTFWGSQTIYKLPNATIYSGPNGTQNSNATTYSGANGTQNSSSTPCALKHSRANALLIIITSVSAASLGAGCIIVHLIYRRKYGRMKLRREFESAWRASASFSLEEIEDITDKFSEELGKGGFGTVYKGRLKNGKLVAVKRLHGISQQEHQFKAEMATLGRIHHINLVQLVGFCCEGNERLLVFEFMEKGSLDRTLFQNDDNTDRSALDWRTRYNIILEIARGIEYLHEQCLDCILHCDIKPQNILLDSNFNAKVADFGMAYWFTREHAVKMSNVRGTRGYMAPEWVLNSPITAKADVFSFGMLVMEIISGRSNYLHTFSAMAETNDRWSFPLWAYGRNVEEVVDPRIDSASTDYGQVELVLKVAFACSQGNFNARPSMGKVVQMLEGTSPVPEFPPPAPFPHGFRPVESSVHPQSIEHNESNIHR
ncbi:hypothetical protein KP509_02G083300 [Ceratopteris richardii]|uniref:Receptor-like serine/threonine-protein kinase n=2 Tax=Ceratopteris richardii TaxID=49495 RepID=A0A8T2VG29_CERRI|nr:hypothetical protein KP509_02G083300 [Ceratopteris richardii]